MDPLRHHVEQLFRPYRGSSQAQELREEVLSNLEARVADLTAGGMAYDQAVRVAKSNLPSIDILLGGKRRIRANGFWLEWVQRVLLYLLVAWIVSMPLQIVGAGEVQSLALFSLSLLAGLIYAALLKKKQTAPEGVMKMDLRAAIVYRNTVWTLWTIYMIVSTLYTTALQFGSSIWFGRPVTISGPYQFAMIAIPYLLPVVSIVLPLAFHLMPKLIMKYEVGEADERDET